MTLLNICILTLSSLITFLMIILRRFCLLAPRALTLGLHLSILSIWQPVQQSQARLRQFLIFKCKALFPLRRLSCLHLSNLSHLLLRPLYPKLIFHRVS